MLDLFLAYLSIYIAFHLRFNFNIPEVEWEHLWTTVFVLFAVRGSVFLFMRSYSGYVRYTSSKDVQRLLKIVLIGSIAFPIINLTWHKLTGGHFPIPTSIVFIDFFILSFAMIGYRLIVKVVYFEYKSSDNVKETVVIFGAGESGIITKRTFDRDGGRRYRIAAFVDENPKKAKLKIEGIDIISLENLEALLAKKEVDRLIISVQNLDPNKKAEIIKICLPFHVKVQSVPPVSKWINGELSANQIRNVKIEDLLGRAPIQLNEKAVVSELRNKRILITGAAGSIGSGLVFQIGRFAKGKLILLDQAESGLYDLEVELKERFANLDYEIVIGDIRNFERMERLFDALKPEMVFHAAAYKHVPLMEENPTEAIRTNVMGTKNMVDISDKYGVDKFVLISTDKAVNPTNVMGASKRIAEIYAQTKNKSSNTKFITTRFGNVLGSNGSVIPLFRKQIEKGGPITVTDPRITRFFMTIPEACQLVLEAAAMGKGGEIFIFDMGESVKIIDLAKQMVKLSGLELGKDMQIVYSGLRPGEKLFEELLANTENTTKTHHPRILIATVRSYEWDEIEPKINALIQLYDKQDNVKAVRLMKDLVPEFVSMNSPFESIDRELGRETH
jgi:FlaA1/EpsC-like NDP-sugar epimerase